MTFLKALPEEFRVWLRCTCCEREARYIHARGGVWFVCTYCRIRWAAPANYRSADWDPRPDGLMSAADRDSVPMAWSDAEVFAYREKMLAQFKDVGSGA